MQKDLIIGCYTEYTWDKIKFWVNSIEKSGFTGDKAMIVYNSDYDTVQQLIDRKFIVYAFNQDDVNKQVFYNTPHHIVVQRFLDLYNAYDVLNLQKYRYIIHTDVKDVVFQLNPSEWLTNNLFKPSIVASSESLHYKNEPWGNDNLRNSFPDVYNDMKENIIWNCGVQAGSPELLKDLWLNIYLLSCNSKIHNSDQAAYNVLLNMEIYKQHTLFVDGNNTWAAQLGTTYDPQKIKDFLPYLTDNQPIISNNVVCNNIGEIFTIVHQYDRIHTLKNQIEFLYGN